MLTPTEKDELIHRALQTDEGTVTLAYAMTGKPFTKKEVREKVKKRRRKAMLELVTWCITPQSWWRFRAGSLTPQMVFRPPWKPASADELPINPKNWFSIVKKIQGSFGKDSNQ